MVRDLGNVELFELCETIPKVQCKECLLYWSGGIVNCTFGHLLKVKPTEAPFNVHCTLSQFNCVINTEGPHDHRLGRPKNKENIILPIIWERDAKREGLKGFTIVSSKIPYFVNLNSKLIELKKSVSRWTRTRRKISPIEWRKTSTLDSWWISLNKSGKIGRLRNRSDFNDALTTSKPSSPRIWRRTTQANSILEIPARATVIEFFLQHNLVAMERFLVELMTINKKVRNWAHVKSDIRVQLTVVCCNRRSVWTPHLTRPFLTVNYMHTHGSSLGPHSFHLTFHVCPSDLSSTTPLSSPSSPSSLLSPCPSFFPSTSSSRMRWANSLCTSANKDLGTLAEYDPLTHETRNLSQGSQEKAAASVSPYHFCCSTCWSCFHMLSRSHTLMVVGLQFELILFGSLPTVLPRALRLLGDCVALYGVLVSFPLLRCMSPRDVLRFGLYEPKPR